MQKEQFKDEWWKKKKTSQNFKKVHKIKKKFTKLKKNSQNFKKVHKIKKKSSQNLFLTKVEAYICLGLVDFLLIIIRNVSQIYISEARWLFLSQFWLLLNKAPF